MMYDHPIDPYKQARIAGGMTFVAVQAANALKRGDTEFALERLRAGLEQYDAQWAEHVWPTELDRAA